MSAPWGRSTGTSSSAWPTVRGNPSRRNEVFPSSHWFFSSSFFTSFAMKLSGKRSPLEMYPLAVFPISLPRAISFRKMSPVEREWICGSFFSSLEVRVPLPEPGAPMMTIRMVLMALDVIVFCGLLYKIFSFLWLSPVSRSSPRLMKQSSRPFRPRETASLFSALPSSVSHRRGCSAGGCNKGRSWGAAAGGFLGEAVAM